MEEILKALKALSKEYLQVVILELQSKIVTMWSGNKKDRDKALKEIMHYLLDKGRINTTHEEIDKR